MLFIEIGILNIIISDCYSRDKLIIVSLFDEVFYPAVIDTILGYMDLIDLAIEKSTYNVAPVMSTVNALVMLFASNAIDVSIPVLCLPSPWVKFGRKCH